MPYADKEKQKEYWNKYRREKRRERGLKSTGRPKLDENQKELSRLKRQEYLKEWNKQHPWSEKDTTSRLLYNAKKRAMQAGIEFSITKEDIVIPTHCPYLGIKLVPSNPRGTSRRDVCSLDRIDNTKGYIKGNVEVISHLANTMKNDATPELLLKFADAIINRLRLL